MPISRATLGIAVALAALLIVGVIVISKLAGSGAGDEARQSPATAASGPVALVPVDAPDAGSAACDALLKALPAELTSGPTVLRRRPVAEPAPPATVAWGTDPVVLRCGLTRPPELTPTSQLREISGVGWLPVAGTSATTWYAVDRAVYVALTVPDGTGTGVLQGVSEVVGATVAERSP